MSAPPADGPAVTLACPRCAAPVADRQEYCLECGVRLPTVPPGAAARARAGLAARHPWSGGWAAPTLVGLAIALFGTGGAIAISNSGSSEAGVSTAIGGSLTVTATGETLTAPEPPARTTAPPAAPAPPPPARPQAPATLTWPDDTRGWTIVLLSVPQRAGRAAAEEQAEAARRKGLRRVGVLNSSRFASLHPGYFVVFNGVYESQAEAVGALPRVKPAFSGADQREIVP